MSMGMMNSILSTITAKYSTTTLVEYLQLHYKNHINEYKEARANYEIERDKKYKEAEDIALKALRDRDTNKLYNLHTELVTLRNTKPVDRSEQYKNYIELFSRADNATIELTLNQANHIINDTWDWAISAKTINSSYSNSSNFSVNGALR